MRKYPNVPAAVPYWTAAWLTMWRSIGYACERSTWDTMQMWSRPTLPIAEGNLGKR